MLKKDANMTKIAIKEFNKKIGYRLYLRRKILKLSQKKIAEALNVSPQCIQNYESGKNSLNIFYLYKIAIFLGVDVNYFFQDINDTEKLADSNHMQELLKNFVAIKNKNVAKNIESLILCLSNE